ncbi:FAD-binding oxidoreductase [Caenimonas sp. S4]|nr:FAD-binding oxidoreductase [Caenimonas soli]
MFWPARELHSSTKRFTRHHPRCLFFTAGPLLADIDEQWYFKPDAGKVFASPADETLSPPCDAQPDEYDVAVVADRIEQATTLRIRRLASQWAGLRSFVADHGLVAGFDSESDGFFWLAGQGGAGIQTSPGISMAVAGLINDDQLPSELRDLGLTEESLSPSRQR